MDSSRITPYGFRHDVRSDLRHIHGFEGPKVERAHAIYDAMVERATKYGSTGGVLSRKHFEKSWEYVRSHPDMHALRQHFSDSDFDKLETALRRRLGIHESTTPE